MLEPFLRSLGTRWEWSRVRARYRAFARRHPAGATVARRPLGERPVVCHVTPSYFSEASGIGGGERYPSALAAAMARHADVTLVSFGPARDQVVIDGVRHEIFPVSHPGNTFCDEVFAITGALDRCDVVHCHQYATLPTAVAARYGRHRGARVFITDHGGRDGRIRGIAAAASRSCDGLLAVSAHSLRTLPRHPPRRVIYGGVDPAFLAVDKAVVGPRFVYVGRILPHKGIDVLIEALPAGVPLEIHGRPQHGAYMERLRSLAAGRMVEFHLQSSDADVRAALARATALVLPSVHRDCYGETHPDAELLGLVLLEAMASGTCVVCTDVGGMPEIVSEGVTGFIVPGGDAAGLGDRLRMLAADGPRAAACGAAGRRDVERRFTWDAVARECLDAYRSLPA